MARYVQNYGAPRDSEDPFGPDRDEAAGVGRNVYVAPPKEEHPHPTFGGNYHPEVSREVALAALIEAATKGDCKWTSQYRLGMVYLKGIWPVDHADIAEARKWLEKSAEYGWPDAVEELRNLGAVLLVKAINPTISDNAIKKVVKTQTELEEERRKLVYAKLPPVLYARVDVGRVVDNVPEYIVMVKTDVDKGIHPAVSVAWDAGVVLERQFFKTRELAETEKANILVWWGYGCESNTTRW